MTVQRYRQIAVVTAVGLVVLTVAGAVVRLTGSGLGCADWPGCSESRFVDVSSTHTAIEQINRLLSGLIGLPTLALLVVALRATRRGEGLRWPAVATFALVIANGLVGRFVVSEDLHPAVVQSHFLLAMAAVAVAVVAAVRGGEAVRLGAVRRWTVSTGTGVDLVRLATLVLVGATAAALATGTIVTGAGPHAGDENARRFGLDIASVARVHGATVMATLALAVGLAVVASRRSDRRLQGDLSAWLFVGLLQAAIGYAQYFSGVPELLVAAHVGGATVLWAFTVRLAVRSVGVDPAPAATARGGDSGTGAVESRSRRGSRSKVPARA